MTDRDDEITRLERDRNDDGRPENARPRDRFGAPLPRDAEDEMPDRVEPEDVVDTVEETVARAVTLFDERRFFEAHEFFEWAWKGPMTADDQRPLFKGLAQLCVGYTHIQRGNATGATSLLQRGIDHVGPFGSAGHGIDLTRAVQDARGVLAELEATAGAPAEARQPDLAAHVTFPTMPRTA